MRNLKKFILPLICILTVIITFALIFNMRVKLEERKNANNIKENTSNVENIVKDIENEVQEENIIEDDKNLQDLEGENTTISEENTLDNEATSSEIYEQKSDVGSTDKKQEAINLVKQKWGEDNTVTFRCDSVKGNGEYIIAVVSNKSGSVKNYFTVNLEKNMVQIDY